MSGDMILTVKVGKSLNFFKVQQNGSNKFLKQKFSNKIWLKFPWKIMNFLLRQGHFPRLCPKSRLQFPLNMIWPKEETPFTWKLLDSQQQHKLGEIMESFNRTLSRIYSKYSLLMHSRMISEVLIIARHSSTRGLKLNQEKRIFRENIFLLFNFTLIYGENEKWNPRKEWQNNFSIQCSSRIHSFE